MLLCVLCVYCVYCRLVPTLKITDSFPNKIRHKLRQYSIQVVHNNQLKNENVTDWTAAETKTHSKHKNRLQQQHTRHWTRLYHSTSPNASTAASTHGHYTTLVGYATAHPTVRSYRLRETFFSMCRAVCLELTFRRVCHRKRLIVCIQI